MLEWCCSPLSPAAALLPMGTNHRATVCVVVLCPDGVLCDDDEALTTEATLLSKIEGAGDIGKAPTATDNFALDVRLDTSSPPLGGRLMRDTTLGSGIFGACCPMIVTVDGFRCPLGEFCALRCGEWVAAVDALGERSTSTGLSPVRLRCDDAVVVVVVLCRTGSPTSMPTSRCRAASGLWLLGPLWSTSSSDSAWGVTSAPVSWP